MNLSLKIDTVENISEEDFRKNYLIPQKPLLIKGSIYKDCDASRKWTKGYIDHALGNVEVDVYDNRIKEKQQSAYTGGDLTMKFSDFLADIMQDKHSDYRLFLFNGFKYNEQLRKDFPCPKIFKGILGKIGFMFFGGKNSPVRMHQDIDMCNVLLTQCIGRKQVYLYSPEYSDLLYRTPFNTFSIANFENPDYAKFPGLQYAKGYNIMMDPGDSLFMPSGYWHYVIYLEGGFAVSYRKMAVSLPHKLQGVLNLTFRLWIDKLMNKISPAYWVKYKHDKAFKNANRQINKIDPPYKGTEVKAQPAF